MLISGLLVRLSPSSCIVKGGSEEIPFPLLLLSDNKLLLLLYDTEQDKLVNELMIYPSSGAVETLASLNNWTNIHMDIEVLRLGLSNRKIYTVQFYLKTLFEGFCQQWNAPLSENWLEKVKKESSMWSNILHMVLDNIKENLNDSFSCQYAQQLLQIVISMVIQILEVIQSKKSDENLFLGSEKTSILKKFSSFLLEMRKLLREENASSSVAAHDEEDVSSMRNTFNITLLSQWRKWENLDYEDIIQDSLLNGTIPMAQSYFFSCGENQALCSFKYFETASEHFIYSYLRQGLMEETLTVLLNMGINVNSKLVEIYKSTPEKDIRSLLSSELQKRELLSEKDAEILQFVSLLENLYPCTSFEHARLLLNEKCSVLETEMNCATPESEEVLPVGDFMPFNLDNSESGAYCRIIINWLVTWDDDVKSRILSPQILKNYPVLDFFFSKEGKHIEINPVSVWYYLLENGNLPYLTNWVEVWLGIQPKSSDGFSLWEKWPLNEVMINAIPEKAPTHVSETLLNKLARFGIFCEEELEDISMFLTRIGHSQCDIYNMEIFTSDKASLSFSDLCHRLVHYCLKHQLIHFLYIFLSRNLRKFTSWPLCRLCDVPLLKLTKAYCWWSQSPQSAHLAYDAIVGTAQYIYKLPSTSAVELFTNVPIPLSIGTSLFKSQSLMETINKIQKSSPESVDRVKGNFQPYPVLYNYLFKSEEERLECDVTVYDLLKGSTVFDTTQLFGWQSANTLKSEGLPFPTKPLVLNLIYNPSVVIYYK
ncbi:spatacsin-like [Uloborus diversus]|uniref:spatacsin-like n=1 Tax=Uloborus diversus TaxID=327109 RepID=UPI00240A049F|nr:spatacsin-like [Uloborus diversus]